MVGSFPGCCARAAAAPPKSVMKSLRFICHPRLRTSPSPAESLSHRGLAACVLDQLDQSRGLDCVGNTSAHPPTAAELAQRSNGAMCQVQTCLCQRDDIVKAGGLTPEGSGTRASAKRLLAWERVPFGDRPAMNYILKRSLLLALFWIYEAGAQEGYLGRGHESWHHRFYQTLERPDNKTSCCNGTDCRPTSGRQVGDHYEVKVNGSWVSVPAEKILKIVAPDLGFHVCAPFKFDGQPNHLYCVVIPPEI